MNGVQQLHREAMDLAAEAMLKRAVGDIATARSLLRAAFEKERQAAEALSDRFDLEPTRSVLFRSAAALALDCGDHRAAEKMAAHGLTGNPPPAIAEELRDLLESANFQRHLDMRGIELLPNEFQMSVTGHAVSSGLIDSDVYVDRVQNVRRLIYRTAERRANRAFRERGRPDSHIENAYPVLLSVPRAGSFCVTFRIGQQMQLTLPGVGLDPAQVVIEDLLECLEILTSDNPDRLEEKIPDPAYRRNFIALARQIAPDGDRVKAVGFTANLGKTEKRVALTRLSRSLSPETGSKAPHDKLVTVRGTLRFADSLNPDRNEIRLLDENDTKHRILVPQGMMEDIVRPLWDREVIVEGVQQKDGILMYSITPVEPRTAR